MKGDFSRLTFDPRKHVVAVRAQQGRVTVDADVNELQDVADHRRRAAAADTIGPVGVPARDPFLVEVDGGAPVVRSGHLWVDGVLVEADDDHAVGAQPHVPAGVGVVRLDDGSWVGLGDATDGRYLAVVDAWRHHVTALDDPSIREVALGGPDTATREQVVWQVRLLRVGDTTSTFGCADPHAAWDAVATTPDGMLAVRAEPDAAAGGPCLVPADAGFRRLENQLYRVEVHDGGDTGVATWKASRDNGAVERALVGITGDQLVVTRPGRDAADGFPSGAWVEVTDDTHTFAGRPGTLVRVQGADGDTITVDTGTATGPLALADFPQRPRVRRWDTDGPRTVDASGWLELEDGVQVRFSAASTWRSGDHWTIPARIATGDVEWPRTGGAPDAVPPHGVRHHVARLAVLSLSGGAWTLVERCVEPFPALTQLRTLDHVAGDGQEALPDPTASAATTIPLRQPLVAGVAAGSLPVQNATVRFSVTLGAGTLDGQPAGTDVDVLTNADGLASVAWAVDSGTPSQLVTARLLRPDGTPEALPVRFGAELSTAATTAYDPSRCPPLAGAVTVQDAIDRLCSLDRGGCATLTLTPGEGWVQALEALPAQQDAVICFRPGRYETNRTVELRGLGNVSIHGGGTATLLRGTDVEQVLAIHDATSVEVRDLSLQAGAVGVTSTGHEHVGGALTITGTPHVDVVGVHARSVAGVRRQAACIAVRGSFQRPTRVRVRDCDLLVGHQQVGVLLVDCADAQVTGNRVAAAPKPGSLGLGTLLADPAIRAPLVAELVGDVRAPVAPIEGVGTVVEVAGWRVGFDSAATSADWQALVAERPPRELADEAAVRAYMTELVDGVVEQPGRLKGLDRTLGVLGRGSPNRPVPTEVVRALAFGGDELAVRRTGDDRGRTTVRVGEETVDVRSPLPASAWAALVEASGVDTDGPARGVLAEVATRVLLDRDLRARSAAAEAWFATLAANNPAVAAQGIVVGGRLADAVRIEGNVVRDVHVGVHVGVSHAASAEASPDVAGRVLVRDNVVRLLLPVERKTGHYGIFLGNTDHGVVSGNDVRATATPATTRVYDEGIRVWGHLGALLRVAENVVGNASTGIRVVPLDVTDGAHQWAVVDNATPNASTSVQAPSSVQRSNNIS